MDSAAISALNIANLTPVAPDKIDDAELRAVIAAILAGESTQSADNTGTVSFQSVFGTIYTATQTNAAITVTAPGDNIGWNILMKHNAASITLTGATLINPDSYVPNTVNRLRLWVEDTGVILAEIIAPSAISQALSATKISTGNNSLAVSATSFLGIFSGLLFLSIYDQGSGIEILLGDSNNQNNGTHIDINDANQTVTIKGDNSDQFIFSLTDGSLTIDALKTAAADGTPVKMVGVDAAGKLVKDDIPSGGGATDLSQTASPTTVTVESSTGNNVNLPLATQTNAGLLSPADKTKLDDAIDINGTGLTVGDILRWDGTEFVRDPFIINDAAAADISCSSIKGSIYGGTTARTEGAITISDSVAGGNAFLRVQNATAGGPTFTFTGGGTVTKVGDWTNGYDTTNINHITLVAVSTSLVYAYLSGVE
jgi:hypothetical protein